MSKIDIHSDELLARLLAAPIYEKSATVHAVEVTEAQHVVTSFGDFVETEQDAQVGEWIVTNPDGEKYVLPAAKFLARYEATAEPNIFKAVGFIHAIRNPYRKDIEIVAPWGEPQFGGPMCWLALSIINGEPVLSDRYIIEADAFTHTYKLA